MVSVTFTKNVFFCILYDNSNCIQQTKNESGMNMSSLYKVPFSLLTLLLIRIKSQWCLELRKNNLCLMIVRLRHTHVNTANTLKLFPEATAASWPWLQLSSSNSVRLHAQLIQTTLRASLGCLIVLLSLCLHERKESNFGQTNAAFMCSRLIALIAFSLC